MALRSDSTCRNQGFAATTAVILDMARTTKPRLHLRMGFEMGDPIKKCVMTSRTSSSHRTRDERKFWETAG